MMYIFFLTIACIFLYWLGGYLPNEYVIKMEEEE